MILDHPVAFLSSRLGHVFAIPGVELNTIVARGHLPTRNATAADSMYSNLALLFYLELITYQASADGTAQNPIVMRRSPVA